MGAHLPDPNDAHVIAAAIHTQAQTIVTENIKDFPSAVLSPRNLEAKTADSFIADTIELDMPNAIQAIREMRERFKNPALSSRELIMRMEASGLQQTVNTLKEYIDLI